MRTVRIAFEVAGYVVGLPLQILIIVALSRGAYRRYPFVFAYATAGFLASAVELPLYLLGKPYRLTYVRTYWTDEQVLLALVYAVVISLIYEATATLRSRGIVRAAVIGGAVLFGATTFLINFNSHIKPGEWMTPWTSELHFCAAILDLGLWALLISVRRLDRRLLVLSGALGIMFTGEAIGESVRQLSQSRHSLAVALIGNVVLMAANQIFLYLWWQAFRTAPPKRALAPPDLNGAEN
jgi:hypothetical protein